MNVNKKKVLVHFILVLIGFYIFCYSYHSINMMLNSAREYPENNFVNCQLVSQDEELLITFENEDLVILEEYRNDKLYKMVAYNYEYIEGAYLFNYLTYYLMPEKELEEGSYKNNLSCVLVQSDAVFINHYKKYLYLMGG